MNEEVQPDPTRVVRIDDHTTIHIQSADEKPVPEPNLVALPDGGLELTELVWTSSGCPPEYLVRRFRTEVCPHCKIEQQVPIQSSPVPVEHCYRVRGRVNLHVTQIAAISTRPRQSCITEVRLLGGTTTVLVLESADEVAAAQASSLASLFFDRMNKEFDRHG